MKYIALFLCASPALAEAPQVPRFVAEPSALTHSFTGEWEFMVGGGVASFDCSGDGKPELVMAGGTSPAQLFLNESTPEALRFTPHASGIEPTAVTGAYALDVDADAITDLMLLRVGENILYRGLGDCRFERANEAWGLQGGDGWTTAFAATWEPGAAWPTLAFGDYIDRREEAFPWGSCTDNQLFRPDPAGGPDARRFGPAIPLTPSFCALSMLFTDWNRSGRPALRVSNDREYYKGGQEQMWHLEPGQPPRLYTEAEGWKRLRIWGMGIAEADLDADGLPEYFLTSMADNKLQVLKAPHELPQYDDQAWKRGVTAHRPYTGGDPRPSTAWHPAFADVNNDGRQDLFVAKGNVWAMPDFAEKDPNNLLLQGADGVFTEAGEGAGVASTLQGRGAAVVDLNADGWLDIVVVNRNGPAEVWRNLPGQGAHWAAIQPRQSGPNRDAIGAWVELRVGEALQRQPVSIGGGHVGGSSGPLHFGLGPAEAAEARILWPDGTASAWQAVTADGLTVIER